MHNTEADLFHRGVPMLSSKAKDATALGIAFGAEIHENFRLELEAVHTFKRGVMFMDMDALLNDLVILSRYSSTTLMGNFYFQVPVQSIVPYWGVGIGSNFIDMNRGVKYTPHPHDAFAKTKNNKFAWQAVFGITFPYKALKIDSEIRYVNRGKQILKGLTNQGLAQDTIPNKNFKNADISIIFGLRYNFS